MSRAGGQVGGQVGGERPQVTPEQAQDASTQWVALADDPRAAALDMLLHYAAEHGGDDQVMAAAARGCLAGYRTRLELDLQELGEQLRDVRRRTARVA